MYIIILRVNNNDNINEDYYALIPVRVMETIQAASNKQIYLHLEEDTRIKKHHSFIFTHIYLHTCEHDVHTTTITTTVTLHPLPPPKDGTGQLEKITWETRMHTPTPKCDERRHPVMPAASW